MSWRATVLVPRKVPSGKPDVMSLLESHQISLACGVAVLTSEKRDCSSCVGEYSGEPARRYRNAAKSWRATCVRPRNVLSEKPSDIPDAAIHPISPECGVSSKTSAKP